MTARKQAATKAPAARRNDPRAQEPEIHLHGDIHVHTYHDGTSSVAIESNNTPPRPHEVREAQMQADMKIQGASGPVAAQGKHTPNDTDMALDFVMNEVQKLGGVLGILDDRSRYYRNQTDSGTMPAMPPFANDSSPVTVQRLQSIFYRVVELRAHVDHLIEGYEPRMEGEMF